MKSASPPRARILPMHKASSSTDEPEAVEMLQPEDAEIHSCELISRNAGVEPIATLLEVRLAGLKLRKADTKEILLSLRIASLHAWSTRDEGRLHIYALRDDDGRIERYTLKTDSAVDIASACFRAAQKEAASGGINTARMRGASIDQVAEEGDIGRQSVAEVAPASYLVEVEIPAGKATARMEVSLDGITLLRDLATGCNVQHFRLEQIVSWKHTPRSFLWYYVPAGAETVSTNFRKLEVFTHEGAAIEAALQAESESALDQEEQSARKSCVMQ